jgi:hypothetical protein
MFHKFKMTASLKLLLIGLFVLPYAGNVADVNAETYNCSGSKVEVRKCLKAVISERDATIVEMQGEADTKKVKNIIIFGGVLYGKETQSVYKRV